MSARQQKQKSVISVNVQEEHHRLLADVLEHHGEYFQNASPVPFSQYLRYLEAASNVVLQVAVDYHRLLAGIDELKKLMGIAPGEEVDVRSLLHIDFENLTSELDNIRIQLQPLLHPGFDYNLEPESPEFWGVPATYAAYTLLSSFLRQTPDFPRLRGKNALDYIGSVVAYTLEEWAAEADQQEHPDERHRRVILEVISPVLPRMGLQWIEPWFQGVPSVVGGGHLLGTSGELQTEHDLLEEMTTATTVLFKLGSLQAGGQLSKEGVAELLAEQAEKLQDLESKHPGLTPEALGPAPQALEALSDDDHQVAKDIRHGRRLVRVIKAWVDSHDDLAARFARIANPEGKRLLPKASRPTRVGGR